MASKKPTRSKARSVKPKATKPKSGKATPKKTAAKFKLKRAGGGKRPGGDGNADNPPPAEN